MPAASTEFGGAPVGAPRALRQAGRARPPGEALFAFRSAVDAVRLAAPRLHDVAVDYSDATMDGTVAAVESVLCGRVAVPPPEGAKTRQFIRAVRQELMLSWHVRCDMIPAADLRRLMNVLDAVSDASQESVQPSISVAESALLPAENLLAAVHDLRSPLTSILLLVESLRSQNGGPVTDIQRRQLNLVYDAALGLSITSSNLVEALREDGAGGTVAKAAQATPFSVAEVLYGVRDILLPVAEERGVELRLRLPDTDARAGHPTLLSRILLNLTSNALRETGDGGVDILVTELADGLVCYQVRDSGPGMDAAALESRFGPVAHTHSRPHDWLASAGLGLVMCRRMARVMGGELRVESSPGAGTTFSLTVNQPPASGSGRKRRRRESVRQGYCTNRDVAATQQEVQRGAVPCAGFPQ